MKWKMCTAADYTVGAKTMSWSVRFPFYLQPNVMKANADQFINTVRILFVNGTLDHFSRVVFVGVRLWSVNKLRISYVTLMMTFHAMKTFSSYILEYRYIHTPQSS